MKPTKVPALSCVLPERYARSLRDLAIKALMASADHKAGRESPAYKKVITEIDLMTVEIRRAFPAMYKSR